MDKENKKLRQDARRDWNQRVRALVDFAKRKDKRVHAWKLEQEVKMREKEEALAKKIAEDRTRRLLERKELLASVKKERGRNTSNSENHAQLKEMESWMANEYGDEEYVSEEEEAYHCEICNKVFRTLNSFSSHERSKRHVALMQRREEMKEESSDASDDDADAELEADESELNVANASSEDEIGVDAKEFPDSTPTLDTRDIGEPSASAKTNGTVAGLEGSENESDEEDVVKLLKIKGHRVKTQSFCDEEDIDISEIPASTVVDNKVEDETKKTKKKRRANKSVKTATTHPPDDGDCVSVEEPDGPKLASCLVCKTNFKSRTALFEHLKATKHAVPVQDKQAVSRKESKDEFNGKERGKKGKGNAKRR
jgi:DnaJ family protein A protein 5